MRPRPPAIVPGPAPLRRSSHIGRTGGADPFIRQAWICGITDTAQEQRFLLQWGSLLTPQDQRARFDRLFATDPTAATRQLARLDATDRPRAEAVLALRRDDPDAAALVAALPRAGRTDWAVVLEQAHALRRTNQDDAAVALWKDSGTAAERAAPAEHRAAFWDERNIMARRRLRQGDAAGAYAIADGHAQPGGEALVDAEFLAGFIALRKLNDAAGATRHFQSLAALSKAGITQGRAHYWLGRAADLRGDTVAANAEYAIAMRWPNTFYGQLAALKHGDTDAALAARITATRDPPADSAATLALASRELARAAAYLVAWGELRRAESFLLRLDGVTPDPPDQALSARLANGFALPEAAVAIARRAGRDGVVLLDTGWPQPVQIPPSAGLEPALALGIIRQESSFDPTTTSPVGARGLMQLMPGTAALVARRLSLPVSLPALLQDPAYNIRLGSAYLHDLLDQFGAVPLAVAGYNAGPARVNEWLGANGDARATTDMIDWIELIPFNETRNYVQRVIENQVIYRAQRHDVAPHPLAAWLH